LPCSGDTAASAAKKAREAYESATAILADVQSKLELPEQLLNEYKDQEPATNAKKGASVASAKVGHLDGYIV
jgi:hypothetical protein